MKPKANGVRSFPVTRRNVSSNPGHFIASHPSQHPSLPSLGAQEHRHWASHSVKMKHGMLTAISLCSHLNIMESQVNYSEATVVTSLTCHHPCQTEKHSSSSKHHSETQGPSAGCFGHPNLEGNPSCLPHTLLSAFHASLQLPKSISVNFNG